MRPRDKVLGPYLLGLTLVFCSSLVAGLLVPPSVRKGALELFLSSLQGFENVSGGMLFLKILLRNTAVTFLTLLFGLLLGVAPLVVISLNGFFLGVVYVEVAGTIGYWNAAMKVIPHGLLEIPALLIAAAYGLWLGVGVYRRIRGMETEPLAPRMKHALERYVLVVVPLLVVAAGIETVLIIVQ